jgi:type II secretory pathway component PulC
LDFLPDHQFTVSVKPFRTPLTLNTDTDTVFLPTERELVEMSSKYAVLNLLLCLVIILLVIENYETWNGSFGLLTGTGFGSQKSGGKIENPPLTASENDLDSRKSYNLISEKNIFSPERTDFPIPAAFPAEAQKPLVRPQIVLYGVAIGGDYQSATVTNPGRALHKEERETRTVRIGGKIGGYTLAKISPDRITMESNGDNFEVLLDDSGNPKRKVQARAKTTLAMVANLQPATVPPSGDAPKAGPSQETVEKPKEPVQARTAQVLGHAARSAAISRRTILNASPAPPAQ